MAEVARRPLPPALRAWFSQQLSACRLHPGTRATKPCLKPRPGPVWCKMGQSREGGQEGTIVGLRQREQVRLGSLKETLNSNLHPLGQLWLGKCDQGEGGGGQRPWLQRERGRGEGREHCTHLRSLCPSSSANLYNTNTNNTERSRPGSPHQPPHGRKGF